ncbi:MAG: 2Fe-2S iron-sulfur cluster-binding protein [Nitrospira sp.]|nr:2Fe-2S iron-sulfur cluster-binding protein [Nitrospira sp.]MDD9860300.1 2Fe-2S iron-sulfur cluster-binding protein [Nitrospira sp.]
MPRVTFVHSEGKSGEVPDNVTLLDAAGSLGFPLNHDCGGSASCSTCRVEVMMGGEHLSEIDFDEQDLLDREALTEPYHRLSCQALVLGDVVVRVPEDREEPAALGWRESSDVVTGADT